MTDAAARSTRRRRLRKLRTWLVWLLVLGGLGGGGYWWQKRRAKDEAESAAAAVRTTQVERGTLTVKAAASGTISPHRRVDVRSRSPGEVIQILVTEGQTVDAGAQLVKLDPYNADRELELRRATLARLEAELAQAEAAVGVAKVQAGEARSDAKVQADGVAMGLVAPTAKRTSKSQASVASRTVTQREAQVAVIRAQITSANVDIVKAERSRAETEIVAPFKGTILSIGVEIGDIVSSAITSVGGGTAMITLADLSDLRVIGQVDEAQIARVKRGQSAEIRVDAYSDRVFVATVERVSQLGVALNNVVSFDVELRVTDNDRALLRPGMTADVEIASETIEKALLVPLTAIATRGDERLVRLPGGGEKIVKTGPHDGVKIVIREGLDEGEAILPIAAQPKAADSKGPSLLGPPRGAR